jgi:nucleoside-diphosphate-sugar epimerase
VIHTADSSDNLPAARAIAKGLSEGHTREKPGYWLHICGTGILQWYDETYKRFGQPPFPGEVYDDIDDIHRILTLPDQAYHRDCDRIVLSANHSPGSIKTAIVGPPTIYGLGRGPVNTRSIQVYALARFALEKGYAPYVGTGKVEWDNVHIHDLSDLFVTLTEAALDPSKNKDPDLFGSGAYYFAEHGTHVWGEVAGWIAEEVKKQGYAQEAKVVGTDMEGIKDGKSTNSTWGTNSRSRATRARKYFGWTPKGKSLKEEIPDIVRQEAERIGLTPKYATQ